jgi:hypothetical protein
LCFLVWLAWTMNLLPSSWDYTCAQPCPAWWDGVSLLVCLGWPSTVFLISASHAVTGISGMYHHTWPQT